MSWTVVNTSCAVCIPLRCTLTFPASCVLCTIVWGWSPLFPGVHDCARLRANFSSLSFSPHLHWPSQAPRSSYIFQLTHRLSNQRLSLRIFQPLLTQMNICRRLLSGCLLHFLIHLHDSICLPSEKELCLNFRHGGHFSVFTVIWARGSF